MDGCRVDGRRVDGCGVDGRRVDGRRVDAAAALRVVVWSLTAVATTNLFYVIDYFFKL